MRAYPNINVSLYDGAFDTGCDCPEENCRFGLFEIMPPIDGAKCIYNKYSCHCHEARAKAIEAVIRRLKKELKDLQEE